jgi:hypothetical protein
MKEKTKERIIKFHKTYDFEILDIEKDPCEIKCNKCNNIIKRSVSRIHQALYSDIYIKCEFCNIIEKQKKIKKYLLESNMSITFTEKDNLAFTMIGKKEYEIKCNTCNLIFFRKIYSIYYCSNQGHKAKCPNYKNHKDEKDYFDQLEKSRKRVRKRKDREYHENLRKLKQKHNTLKKNMEEKFFEINSNNACKIVSCIPSQEFIKPYLDKFNFIIDPLKLIKKFQNIAHKKNITLIPKSFCTFIIFLSSDINICYFSKNVYKENKTEEELKEIKNRIKKVEVLGLSADITIRDLFKRFKLNKKFNTVHDLRDYLRSQNY